MSYNKNSRRLSSSNNPNEGLPILPDGNASLVEHPDDEDMDPVIAPPPPSIHRRPLQQHSSSPNPSPLPQLLSSQQPMPTTSHHHVASGATSSIASKPHAFGGAVLSPDHARNLTTDLALQLASALSVQANQSASSLGVLPPGENVNLFKGSDLVDVLTGWKGGATSSTGTGSGAGSVFRSATLSAAAPTSPGTPKSNADAPSPHILHLLHHGGLPSPTPKQSTPGTLTPSDTPADNPAVITQINPLSLLSTAEALESFAAWRTHYTVWITEAWHILNWSEPSAALFWEMATMFHTLYVASLSVRGGGSGGVVRGRMLGVAPNDSVDAAGMVGGSSMTASGTTMKSSTATATITASTASTGNYIPPLLSCGSQSSMGSAGTAGMSDAGERKDPSNTTTQSSHGNGSAQPSLQTPTSTRSAIKPARHSAKELPVWLISMFLLVHCETESFLRCTSGEDHQRYGDGATVSPLSGDAIGEGSLDFSALLHHKSLSPRTRLHAGTHQNNANCASFLLRHLRKFVLLCAVPRNVAACTAVAQLAAQSSSSGSDKNSNLHRYSGGAGIDIQQIEQDHQKEHGDIGLTVELTVEELDRLHLVLQAPSGGLVDDPPIAIGEFIVRCLVSEEMEAAQRQAQQGVVGSAGGMGRANVPVAVPVPLPTSQRWNLMQNGLITVADAERILRRYLEEELTMAKQELDGEDNDHSSEDVASKLSRLSLGSTQGETASTSRYSPGSIQPLSPPRSRGVSLADSVDAACTDTKDSSSYLKELSYQKLRSTTVLLEPGKDTTTGHGSSPTNNNGNEESIATDSQEQQSQTSRSSSVNQQQHAHPAHHSSAGADSPNNNEHNGRLHDLHVADCTDTHFYLLQPFEHATIAACTDCTIVLGAVAGLLHVVDCERTTITSAARRVVVSNSFDVVHYLFTPSPPLLVGDNRGCQFAPYNTYYEGLREDLLATGLAAVLRSATPGGNAAKDSSSSRDGSVVGDNNTTASPGRGGNTSPTNGALPTLQCASNKWKVPVELCKLEVPQLPNVPTPGSPANLESPSSPGADDHALGGSGVDVAMKTPVLLPASEFDVLLVPVESEEARIRRRLLREVQAEAAAAAAAAAANNNNEEEPSDNVGEEANETTTVYSTTSSLTGITGGEKCSEHEQPPPAPESDYCRILADLLTLSPFHMPHDYERRVISKAERVRTLREAIVQELTEEGRSSLEEELNRGFQDWLVTSGNLRQVLDLIHLEKRVSAT
mmetsp:Transcript_25995/g.46878  ORF Transcript_25995/g.46878 Transcript_25995/m.46878 type:complete len:1240 (-) Transcript_25995:80-3799(-)